MIKDAAKLLILAGSAVIIVSAIVGLWANNANNMPGKWAALCGGVLGLGIFIAAAIVISKEKH